MRTPRDVSSARLIRHLEREWGYSVVRQKGSHILLTTEIPSHHSVPVPQRSAIGVGLLRSILGQVAEAKGVRVEDVMGGL